jgi:hypothetical protein
LGYSSSANPYERGWRATSAPGPRKVLEASLARYPAASQVSEERSVLADMRMVQHFKIHMAQEERDLLGLMIAKSEYSRDKNNGGAWNMTLLPKDI